MFLTNNYEYYLLRNGKRVLIYPESNSTKNQSEKIFILKELDENFYYFDTNISIQFLEKYKNTILHYWPEISYFLTLNKNSIHPNIFKNNNIKLYYLYQETLQNLFSIYPNVYIELLEEYPIIWQSSNYNLNDTINFINNKFYIKYIYDYLIKSIKIHPDYYTNSQIGFTFYNRVYFKFNTHKMGKILEI